MRHLLLLTALALLTACGGSSPGGPPPGGGAPGGGGPGGGDEPRAADLRITAIAIRGALPQPTSIAVRAVPDQDGEADAVYRVGFSLGGSGPTALPTDDGVTWSAEFPVTGAGGAAVDAVTVRIER